MTPDQTEKVQIQTKTKNTETEKITINEITNKTIDTTTVAIHKTTYNNNRNTPNQQQN